MAGPKKKLPETRTFTKQVGGETVTREVTSPQAETAALYDGFTEQASAKSSGGSGSSGSRTTSTGTANSSS